ncbi:NlpC/P60 family protein [Sporosarcina saromensis]|uniref:NlpC/P60 family protein n=1 Tax=Sporosarcina saromensis TaxID=359365 RepID=A0ABU4GAV2_9BACL|nr:NlpC/P60 family protein [Sporosarcina saromensis]MDW0114026.1 NlpC/P60 family protein [Sporosarcina saromensis]
MSTKKYAAKTIAAVGLSAALLFSPFANIEAQASVNSSSLVNTSKQYISTPYVYGGSTPSGFDCSGYTQYVFKKEGVSIPRTTNDQYARGTAVSKSNLQTGDLVFFKTFGSRPVSHVGIYIGSGKFIHASTSKGVMISSVNDPYYWGSRYVGAKRITDVSSVTQTSNSVTGWKKENVGWKYYQNGAMKKGWAQVNSKWYYMNQSGVMQTGWLKSAGKWYFMNQSGDMRTGWSKVNSKWYFHNASGAMLTGWVQTGGKWYYFYSNGQMAANTTIGGYQLNSSGAWIQ